MNRIFTAMKTNHKRGKWKMRGRVKRNDIEKKEKEIKQNPTLTYTIQERNITLLVGKEEKIVFEMVFSKII